MYGWGYNGDWEQIGVSAGNNTNIKSPTLIEVIGTSGTNYVVDVSTTPTATMFLLDNGDIYMAGTAAYNPISLGINIEEFSFGNDQSSSVDPTVYATPTSMTANLGSGIQYAAMSQDAIGHDTEHEFSSQAYIYRNNTLYVWGAYEHAVPRCIGPSGDKRIFYEYSNTGTVSEGSLVSRTTTPQITLSGISLSGMKMSMLAGGTIFDLTPSYNIWDYNTKKYKYQ